ncbi:hypothetical protein G6734_02780 [Polynucleobacter paneuropaeus]|jgi:hypothetical protein|nr:hypothetical protein [Polynucleobacter paneuropaeus]
MKFIGLFLMFIAFVGLQQEITLSGLAWFLVGAVCTGSELIGYWIKTEIRASYRNRQPPYRTLRR